MDDRNKPKEADKKPWTRQDEENLLLEISEDRRLVRLGIDPDAPQIEIYLELIKRMKALDEEKAARQASRQTKTAE